MRHAAAYMTHIVQVVSLIVPVCLPQLLHIELVTLLICSVTKSHACCG
jgi:hypothetical protein